MKRRFTRSFESIACGAMVFFAAAFSSNALVAGPFDPALIIPTPVARHCAFAKDHSVPRKRAVAILSPIESPDRCPAYVGGKTIYTRYYPDYLPYRKHGDRIMIPGNGYGYLSPDGDAGVPGAVASPESAESAARDYGYYSGARQDETNLLRLGGNGEMSAEPPTTQIDLIDELECRGGAGGED